MPYKKYMKNLKEQEILENFVRELVDEFPVGEKVVMKIYVFYRAYIERDN
uniref:Uncharacterized protein n=2 Tax=viral metagenome TaxID=1070528 RepID=A0A6H1ZFE8_9ZZZZ